MTKQPSGPELDPSIVNKFLETQQKKAENDAKEIDLKGKNIEHQAEYARNLLEKQHDLLKNKPRQDRYNILIWSSVSFVLVVAYASFILILLRMGKDNLVDIVLTWSGRVIALVVTFILGRISAAGKKSESEEAIAEVIED